MYADIFRIKCHNVYSLVSNGWAKNNTHVFTDKANTTRCQQIPNLEDHDKDVHSISNFLYAWNCFIIKKVGGECWGAQRTPILQGEKKRSTQNQSCHDPNKTSL